MSFPTVSFGTDLLQHAQLAYLEVRQALNEHWRCSFVRGQGSEQAIPVNDWLGKTLQISSTDEENAEQVHFTGFILSVDSTTRQAEHFPLRSRQSPGLGC